MRNKLGRRIEVSVEAFDRHHLIEELNKVKKEGEPFLYSMIMQCGCEEIYNSEEELPYDNEECEHGNFHIQYSPEYIFRNSLQDLEKEDLENEVVKREAILNALEPELEIARYEKLSWLSLPVILQDLGFNLKEEPAKGDMPPIDIYYRDGIACFKDFDNSWVVTKDDYRMKFVLPTKFHAYQLFTMLGIKFKDEDSTAAGLDRPIADILKEAENEEE